MVADMAILSTVDQPFQQPGVASIRPYAPQSNMLDPRFYSKPQVSVQPPNGSSGSNAQPQFDEPPKTGDFLSSLRTRLMYRTPAPNIQPAQTMKPTDPSVTDPSQFQSYFQQLQQVGQMGTSALADAQQQAQQRRIQALQDIANQQVQSPNVMANPYGQYTGSGPESPNGGGVPSNPRANFQFAQQLANQFGWNDPRQLSDWYQLGMMESGWNNTAQNPTSTAYGIGQFLDSTWGGYGVQKTSDPYQQVLAMARYIQQRYGSPANALAHEYSSHWY